jgi:hypothetical protein
MHFLERAIDLVLQAPELLVLHILGSLLVPQVLLLLVSILEPFPSWFLDLVYNTKV